MIHQMYPQEPSLHEKYIADRTQPDHHFGSYHQFLETFLLRDYQFCLFHELRETHRQVVLRHDIDFDVSLALQVANIEHELGIRSTYFFLLRSNFYNILSSKEFDEIKRIRELGHTVSVHFDPSIYTDIHKGLEWEAQVFGTLFNTDVKIISLHRPSPFFQEFDAPISGIEHTYQSKYFRDVKYFADSTGAWRFGHPHDAPEFREGKSLQVLIHPIWWTLDGPSNLDQLNHYFRHRVENLKNDFSLNCIPFRKIHSHV